MSELIKPDLNKPVFKLMPEQAENIRKGLCALCAKPIKKEELTGEIAIIEYSISGMCQQCQDKAFTTTDLLTEDID